MEFQTDRNQWNYQEKMESNKVSNRIKAIHLRFDRNLSTVWQSRTGNKNFWKCNDKFRSNWTGRSKRTRRRFRSVPFKRSI